MAQRSRSLSSRISSWYELNMPDCDDVFSYETVKEVRVLDRRLGFVYYGVQGAVILYIVVYVFFYKQGYLDTEKTSGWMMCKVMKPQVSQEGLPWDVYDRVTNPGEQGAVFIPTRVLVTKEQSSEGSCESPLHNCSDDTDCHHSNQRLGCAASGRCLRQQWCPAEDASLSTTTTHYLSIDEVELWFQTYVHYHQFNLDVSTTDEKTPIYYPHRRANTYRLRDLLAMAGMELEEFTENGAMVLVNALFTCDLDTHNCDMKVSTQNVDTKTGFNHVHNRVYWEDGVRKRDSYRMYGLRLLTSATGFGSKTSFSQILLQLSSAISLFSFAEMVADFWLQYVVPERRHYVEQKILHTEEFND